MREAAASVKAPAQRRNLLPVHPVAFKMQDPDGLFPAHPLDFVHGRGAEIGERTGIDDLEMMIHASDMAEHLPVQGKVCGRVLRAVQMIITECAALPPASGAAQQDDFPRVFVRDHRITHHFFHCSFPFFPSKKARPPKVRTIKKPHDLRTAKKPRGAWMS